MKGEKDYNKAIGILNNLHKSYRKFSRTKVLSEHSRYIALVRKAAYKGNVEAQFELGLNYEDQNYFLPNPMYNKARRFYWYQKASSSDHAEACNNLASLYERGDGVKKNIKMALFYYKKSYKLGCNYAKRNYNLLLATN